LFFLFAPHSECATRPVPHNTWPVAEETQINSGSRTAHTSRPPTTHPIRPKKQKKKKPPNPVATKKNQIPKLPNQSSPQKVLTLLFDVTRHIKAENFLSPTDNAKSYAKEKTQSDQTT
jgi:hypothetical protein